MLHISTGSKGVFPETLQQTCPLSNSPCPNQSLAPGMGHKQSGETSQDSPPGGDPHREGEGAGLNRIGVLLGARGQGDVCNNGHLEKA